MQSRNFWLSKEVFIGLAFGLLLAVPVFVFGGSKQVFVDKDSHGTEDGTETHPYHTISKALKHAKEGTDVHIAKGVYRENITLPKGVKLFGKKKDKGDVVIKADNGNKPTVTMKHQTELNYLTIQDGRHGIRVLEDAKVKIYKVSIKKSNRDGIHIDSAPRDKKHRALIDSVEVQDSDQAGIFSEKRDVVIIDSYIHNNGGDGIDLALGMDAWLENNRFNDNKGSGAKFVLDGASVFGKKNGFRNNRREGLEVNAFGAAGTIELKKSAFIGNDRYGVSRIARTATGTRMFGNLSFGIGVNDSRFDANTFGGLSPVIRGF